MFISAFASPFSFLLISISSPPSPSIQTELILQFNSQAMAFASLLQDDSCLLSSHPLSTRTVREDDTDLSLKDNFLTKDAIE